jgi:hypothetical protein
MLEGQAVDERAMQNYTCGADGAGARVRVL